MEDPRVIVSCHQVYVGSLLTMLDQRILQIGLIDHPPPPLLDCGDAAIAEPDGSVAGRTSPVPVVGVAWSARLTLKAIYGVGERYVHDSDRTAVKDSGLSPGFMRP
jgi:hypothetical protein